LGMKKFLIVGLGNIGNEYHETRHNIGFMILDKIAKEHKLTFVSRRYGDVAEFRIKGKTVILLKPNTYMNLSGKALNYWLTETKSPIENSLTITDDLSLPTGKIRIKGKGSSGGHNGLQNIEDIINTNKYPRLRFGIGNEFLNGQQINFVLNQFDIQETETISVTIKKAEEAIYSFVLSGINNAMNNFN